MQNSFNNHDISSNNEENNLTSHIKLAKKTKKIISNLNLDIPEEKKLYYSTLSKVIEYFEGKRLKVYQDSSNFSTVGIGFNFDNDDQEYPRNIWDKAFISYPETEKPDFDMVKEGKKELSNEQVYALLIIFIEENQDNLKKMYECTWEKLSNCHRFAIEELFYNGGNALVGKNTRFFKNITQYYQDTTQIENLKNAIHEVKNRSNPVFSPRNKMKNPPSIINAIQRRRDFETEMLMI